MLHARRYYCNVGSSYYVLGSLEPFTSHGHTKVESQ
jgi:hypothetical protein